MVFHPKQAASCVSFCHARVVPRRLSFVIAPCRRPACRAVCLLSSSGCVYRSPRATSYLRARAPCHPSSLPSFPSHGTPPPKGVHRGHVRGCGGGDVVRKRDRRGRRPGQPGPDHEPDEPADGGEGAAVASQARGRERPQDQQNSVFPLPCPLVPRACGTIFSPISYLGSERPRVHVAWLCTLTSSTTKCVGRHTHSHQSCYMHPCSEAYLVVDFSEDTFFLFFKTSASECLR